MTTNDRLADIWRKQAGQQEGFGLAPDMQSPDECRETSGRMCLGIVEELADLQRLVTAYKRHVAHQPGQPINVSDSLADILKYLICIGQLHGVTPELLVESFYRKTRVIEAKARQKRLRLSRDTKLICVDLDDVVCDLSSWSAELTRLRGGAPMNAGTLAMVETYKDDFYTEGRFAELPAIPGAPRAMMDLKAQGYTIVIITARPEWQYSRLYADTLSWLDAHSIPHDLILFTKDKAEAIHHNIRPAWPRCFIEDHPRNALSLAASGVNVLLFDTPHNQAVQEDERIKRVVGWNGVMEAISARADFEDDQDSQSQLAQSMRGE